MKTEAFIPRDKNLRIFQIFEMAGRSDRDKLTKDGEFDLMNVKDCGKAKNGVESFQFR